MWSTEAFRRRPETLIAALVIARDAAASMIGEIAPAAPSRTGLPCRAQPQLQRQAHCTSPRSAPLSHVSVPSLRTGTALANMAAQQPQKPRGLPNPYAAKGLPNPYALATVAESAPVRFSDEQTKAEQKKTPGIHSSCSITCA